MRTFKSLADFSSYLLRLSVALPHRLEPALDRAARKIKNRAQEKFGHYQGDIKSVPEWAELAESTKASRVRLGFTENDPLLRTGSIRDHITHRVYRSAGGVRADIGGSSPVLLYLELGTLHMPPRPTISGALAELADETAIIMADRVVQVIAGRI